jgi:prostaglandin-E synthase
MWAQRNNVVFLTICLEDCKDPQIKLENDNVYFHGVGGTDKKVHEVKIEFYKEIDSEVRYFFVLLKCSQGVVLRKLLYEFLF